MTYWQAARAMAGGPAGSESRSRPVDRRPVARRARPSLQARVTGAKCPFNVHAASTGRSARRACWGSLFGSCRPSCLGGVRAGPRRAYGIPLSTDSLNECRRSGDDGQLPRFNGAEGGGDQLRIGSVPGAFGCLRGIYVRATRCRILSLGPCGIEAARLLWTDAGRGRRPPRRRLGAERRQRV